MHQITRQRRKPIKRIGFQSNQQQQQQPPQHEKMAGEKERNFNQRAQQPCWK